MTSTHRTLKRVLVAALIAAGCGSASAAAAPAADARIAQVEQGLRRIDEALKDVGPPQSIGERMAALHVPGLSIAVFDAGRIVWARGYGVRDVQTQAPAETTTLFQAASVSKPVTSVGLFRLVEQGTVALDDDINTRMRRWQLPDSGFTATHKVTPRGIVTHTSGLGVHGFHGYAQGAPLPTLVQILDGLPPANSDAVRVTFEPGTREGYSGGGFTALQLLMEDVSAQPFPELMQALVLQPAGMTDSTFAQPLPPPLAARAASGHDDSGTRVPGGTHVYPERAAAGLWTTPSDLARFMLSVGRAYRGESGALLTRDSARTMLTPVPNGSGQGFGLSGEGDAFRYRHSGGNTGFRAYAVAFAGSGRGVVLMSNGDNGGTLMHEVARAVSRAYGWPPLWTGD